MSCRADADYTRSEQRKVARRPWRAKDEGRGIFQRTAAPLRRAESQPTAPPIFPVKGTPDALPSQTGRPHESASGERCGIRLGFPTRHSLPGTIVAPLAPAEISAAGR